MIFIQSLLIALFTLISFSSYAQLSVCANYDIESTHPKDLVVNEFIRCMRKGDTFYLDGAVDENLIFELRDFATQKITKIFLNSPGGLVHQAFEAAEFIRENNIETFIRDGARCSSACTLLFQAGVKRYAHPSAKLMFHSVRNLPKSQEKIDYIKECIDTPTDNCLEEFSRKIKTLRSDTDLLFDLYAEYDISPNFYDKYKSLEDDPLWYLSGNYLKTKDWELSARESMDYNIVQELMESE